MERMDVFKLHKAIGREEFDSTRLTSALSEYAGLRAKIHRLAQSGVITRIKNGLYVFGPDYNQAPVCKEGLANMIYGPSYISLEYALSFYGLIPERVETVTSVTPKKDKRYDTPLGRFTYRYLVLKKYAEGIAQVWIDSTHSVLIATPAKALCDYIHLNKIRHIQNMSDAREFLEDDLRIDREKWSRFDTKELRSLNRVFGNDVLSHVCDLLEEVSR